MKKQDTRTRAKVSRVRRVAAGGGMLIALGAAASPALADPGYTLNLSAPSSAVVGQPIVIQASGSNPPTDFFSSWLDVSAIPTSVLSACPAGYLNAFQVASSTGAQGGEQVARAVREDVDPAGNFSIPSVYTPAVAGRFLICGYTNDGASATLATSSLVLSVSGASSGSGSVPSPGQGPTPGHGSARPANVSKPRVKRSGRKLVCLPGRWSNGPTRFSYAWLVNGKAKKGARARKLPITHKLRGRRVQCKVTASNAAGSSRAVSGRFRA
jgi:hypothetical protein